MNSDGRPEPKLSSGISATLDSPALGMSQVARRPELSRDAAARCRPQPEGGLWENLNVLAEFPPDGVLKGVV